jgi:hypothetical protein
MRASLSLALAFIAGCSVPDFFLVDAGGGGDDGGGDDGGVDAKPDAALDAPPGAATVTGVSSTATNGFHKAAATIPIQVTFSAAVTVTGTPTLALNTGVTVNYTSGSGTTALTFTYTVATGNASADLDYTTTSALAVNGGTIKNGTNDAFLTLPAPGAAGSLGANKALVIDAVTPTISTVSGPNAYVATSSATLSYTVTDVNLGTTTCTQTVGTGVMSSCTATGAMFDSLADGPHTVSITHLDAAGNISSAQTYSWTVDTVAPVLSRGLRSTCSRHRHHCPTPWPRPIRGPPPARKRSARARWEPAAWAACRSPTSARARTPSPSFIGISPTLHRQRGRTRGRSI